MEMLRQMANGGLGVSGLGIMAQLVPSVPADLKTWPATAIIGLVALVSMAILAYTIRVNASSAVAIASALATMTQQEGERGRRLDELCSKLGETNDRLLKTNTNLEARPCIMDRKGA